MKFTTKPGWWVGGDGVGGCLFLLIKPLSVNWSGRFYELATVLGHLS